MIRGEGKTFTLIRCASDQDWLIERKKGIGGSDVAAIMGLSPWRTPAEVWLEKTNRVEPQDLSGKPNVVFGNIMEPIIAAWYREQHPGRTVRRVNAICQSTERPWAQASLDYEVYAPLDEATRAFEWGVLEIKTARDARDWHDGVPAYYLTQVTHYMDVTDRPFADVAVFFRDEAEFREYRIQRDEEDVLAVRQAVDTFWHDFVVADVMPQLVGTSGEAQGLTEMYGRPSADSITDYAEETLSLVSAYQDASERERRAKADKQEASTLLMAKIGEHKTLFTESARVTWSRSESERFDTKRFKLEHPDLYAQYASTYTRNGGLRVTDLK